MSTAATARQQPAAFREPGAFFDARIAFFRGKANVPTRTWADLWRQQHNVGFMVAGAYQADLLADLRGAVDAAIAGGESLSQFRRRFDEIVGRHGWQHYGSAGWRSRLIYGTNLRMAHAAGRYRQLTDPAMVEARPYWEYRHSPFVREPRPQHVAWHGLVLAWDDPWWQSHYPPGGWGCRCSVRALGVRQMAQLGKLDPDTAPPTRLEPYTRPDGVTVQVPEGIDPGFDYIPGAERVDLQVRARLAPKTEAGGTLPDQVAAALLLFFDGVLDSADAAPP